MTVIGNAGGSLYSNQTKWANVVDVLVSYEQRVPTGQPDEAAHVPANLSDIQPSNLTTTAQEAVLFHSADAEAMRRALSYVLSQNQKATEYKHVYVTDVTYAEHDVWGKRLSSHLEAQTALLIDQQRDQEQP